MLPCVRSLPFVVGIASAAFLAGCAASSSNPPAQPGPTAMYSTAAESAPAAPVPAIDESKWYKGAVKFDGKDQVFWWHSATDEVNKTCYLMIAAPLDALPSSAPGKGGITAPPRSSPGTLPLAVDYCPKDTWPEASTIENGFMYVIVEPRTSRQQDSPWKAHWIPWPIIVRSPSHPGGAFAGTFVLLTVRDSGGAIERESAFRPNLGDRIPCERIATPDNDDSKKLVHVTGGCCGEEYQYFLRDVSSVDDMKYDVQQHTIDSPSPEAAFLIDACMFAQKAREAIAATPNPEEATDVTKCLRTTR